MYKDASKNLREAISGWRQRWRNRATACDAIEADCAQNMNRETVTMVKSLRQAALMCCQWLCHCEGELPQPAAWVALGGSGEKRAFVPFLATV
jgi:hypothetical protein